MNKSELIERLHKLKDVEPESGHNEADNLLLEYINDQEIRDAYEQLERWYA